VVRRGDPALYVAEQQGRVLAIRGGQVDPTPVLDITGDIQAGGEQGLLGIAFSPDGTKLYVHSTAPGGDTRLQEFAFANGKADPATARTLLTAPGAQSNHNGGQLAFGPDGMLYMTIGDGGGAGDSGGGHASGGNGQSLDTLLGKILRIDPTPSASSGYTIPPDNPFASGGGRPEIWAYGLRNPWRFSFDRSTGDLWIADVGQDKYEEIDFAAAPDRGRGANYGWNIMEGLHPFRDGTAAGPTVAPVLETAHTDGNCSITGGYVYRGTKIPDLAGAYVFSDYCNGPVRAVIVANGQVVADRDLGVSASSITSFGQDGAGELYVISQSQGLLRIDPA
jgi:glucose/arabinose dehydrogenase